MKIYLAGPYSHKDPLIREQRFKMLNKYAAHLMRQGHIVYSPISMSHPIAVDNDLCLWLTGIRNRKAYSVNFLSLKLP